MKEKIVINQDWLVKDMKAGVPELDKLFICQKVEQVPENWEELKGLCRATNYIQDILKKNREGQSIPVHLNDYGTGYVIIKDLYFGENGIVFYEVKEQRYIIAKDLTYIQMWGIIKNLIGEE